MTSCIRLVQLIFYDCSGIISLVIPANVGGIWSYAFWNCGNLESLYFYGNAPSVGEFAFYGDGNATAYYLPQTTGWVTFGGVATALWLPQIQTSNQKLSEQGKKFGLTLSWASGQTIVLESCTNLFNPTWLPLWTNILVSGSTNFDDPKKTNFLSRFYRICSH